MWRVSSGAAPRHRRRKMMENLLQPGRQQEECVRMYVPCSQFLKQNATLRIAVHLKHICIFPGMLKSGELGATDGCLE